MGELHDIQGNVVMFRSWAIYLVLASWSPTALAAPLQIHPRQNDPYNPTYTKTSNVIVGVLSAVAAVIALIAVIILIYFPESTMAQRINMRRSSLPAAPQPLKPEVINTTTTTTVTHHSRQNSRQTNTRSGVAMFAAASSRGTSRGVSVTERPSKIGCAVSDVAVDDDDGCSSIMSSPSVSQLDLEKFDWKLQRLPSAVLSSARYSVHVSSDYAPSEPDRNSRDQSTLDRSSSHRRSSSLFQKPISWLRFSGSASSPSSGSTAKFSYPKHYTPPTTTTNWPIHDLAPRRSQSPSQPIQLPSRKS